MNKLFFFFFALLFSLSSFSQKEDYTSLKPRKMNYNDFMKYSINDTSAVVVDIFLSKKGDAAYGQMSFLPITLVLAVFPPTAVIGVGLTFISAPLFMNGAYMLVKYRNKKLLNVLEEYKNTQSMPNWVRKKANRQLEHYESLKVDY